MQDKNGEPSDWIEIYNPTNKDISLTGFSLSKNGGGDQPLGGYVIKAHDYIIVYCSSAGFENADFPHADFSIGKVSEAEIILKYDSFQCESIKMPKLNKGVSYSKNVKGEMYVSEPTPLAANAEKTIGDTPVFSQAAGSYEKAFDLEITAGESQTVYYTTDGTDPATSDTRKVYENALRIDDRSDDENVLSAYDPMKIQLDYRDSIKLPDKSAVDKGTVIRACAEGTSGKCGKTVTATYFVDVSSADHNDLPIVSITTDSDGLFNEKTGIYCLGDVYKEYDEENPDHPWNGSIPANYNQRGREWEKECYVEYFDSEGNSLISQDCGIRIQGAWSRADYQKSFRLYARNDYGRSSFDTVFWDSFTDVNGEAITSCKTFVLRNGGNDANYSKFKDMMIQNMVSGRGVETQQGTACVVFIDGEYWGLYTLQSDYSDRYFADRYNVAKSNVVMYKNDKLSEGEAEDEKLFNDMYKFITENDMSIEENYRKACAMIDMDNLVEYAATEMYIFNDDWPQNNYACWRTRTIEQGNSYADGRWRFVLISNHKNALNFFDTGDGQGEATFYSYEVTDAGMETAVWDAFCKWFEKTAADSAASYTATFEGDLALASNADTVDSLFFCLADGEGASYTIIPTAPSVPLDRYEYTPIDKPKNLDGLDIIQLWPHNGQATCFEFYEGTNTVKYMSGKSESYYRAIGDFSIVDNDGRTLYNMMRRWYDEAEYDALLRDVKPQPKSLSWQEAAQHWADAYYGAHTKATSGSSFKYTWVKALITPAEDATKVLREEGEIDGSTYCFAVEVQFTPESETALYYAMAGNTDKCTDPSAPKGAYAFWRCCTIQQQGDGRWYGAMIGTGW